MSKRNTKNKKKNKTNVILSRLIILIMLVVSGFLLYFVVKDVQETFLLRGDVSKLQTLLDELEKENGNLTSQKEKLSDEEYIKSYARGEYSFSKEGEQIFKLPGKTGE